jgi:hypothetical protein
MIDIRSNEKYGKDDATVKCSNRTHKLRENIEKMANSNITTQKKKQTNEHINTISTNTFNQRTQRRRWVIADSCATGHFMMMRAPLTNLKLAKTPILITLPDEQKILSPHSHATWTSCGSHPT